MSLDLNARVDRLEKAVSTGLNIDLVQFGPPEHQAEVAAAATQDVADDAAAAQAAAEAANVSAPEPVEESVASAPEPVAEPAEELAAEPAKRSHSKAK